MTRRGFVPIDPNRIAIGKELGPAVLLHDFLIDRQTDSAGRVNYGRPVSYAWIWARWPNAPTVRTLKRWMLKLRACGLVDVRRLPRHLGMTLRLVGSVKWRDEAPRAHQLSLLAPEPTPIAACGKPVEIAAEAESSGDRCVTSQAFSGDKCVPVKK
jgi:hypothetical protein